MCRTFPLNGAVNFLMGAQQDVVNLLIYLLLTAAFLGSQRDSEM